MEEAKKEACGRDDEPWTRPRIYRPPPDDPADRPPAVNDKAPKRKSKGGEAHAT